MIEFDQKQPYGAGRYNYVTMMPTLQARIYAPPPPPPIPYAVPPLPRLVRPFGMPPPPPAPGNTVPMRAGARKAVAKPRKVAAAAKPRKVTATVREAAALRAAVKGKGKAKVAAA